MSTLSRREFLRIGTLAGGAALLAACAPAATPTPAEPEPEVEVEEPEPEVEVEEPEPEVEEPEPTEAPAEEEVVTIRIGTFDWYSGNPDGPWDVFLQEVAFPKFMESRPNIQPMYEPLGGEWEDKILTQMAAGEAPDVISNWSPILETWNQRGQLLDLQPLVDSDLPDADSMFIADAWEQMKDPFTGARMGMVINQDITALYYNRNMFEEAGVPEPNPDWTFDNYEANACAATIKDEDGKTTRWGGRLRGGLWWGWIYHILAFGGNVRDDETRTICLLGEPEAQAALEWLQHVMFEPTPEDNCFARDAQIQATGLPDQSMGGLPGEIVAMAEQSTWGFGILADASAAGGWEWDVTHYPIGPVTRSAQGLPDVRSVYSGVVERGTMEAAWEWMKFVNAEEWFQDEAISRLSFRFPGLLKSVEKWTSIIRNEIPGLENVHIETFPEAVDWGYTAGSPNFRFQREAQELIDPAIEAVLVTGDESPSYFKEIAARVTAKQQELLAESEG